MRRLLASVGPVPSTPLGAIRWQTYWRRPNIAAWSPLAVWPREWIFPLTVLPFILRNVTLAGIDSVNARQEVRVQAWLRLARDLDLGKLAWTTRVVGLADVPEVVARMLEGKAQGRTVVDVNA